MTRGLPIGIVAGGLFVHALDAPHLVRPDQLRAAASVTEGALEIVRYDTQRRDRADNFYQRISDAPWIVGNGTDTTIAFGSHVLLLGDCTNAPPGASYFANFGNALCFWRDSGQLADCPPPSPACRHGR